MPKKRAKRKGTESVKVLNVFEAWLEKQKARLVRGRSGFVSSEQ